MKIRTLAVAVLPALALSSLVAACGDGGDTADRQALEQQALQRDLDLALRPDSALPAFADVPAVDSAAQAPSAAPEPTPAAAAPRPAAPRPAAPARRDPTPARPAEPPAPRVVTRRVPSGTTFAVTLDQQVSTRGGSGQSFSATLAEPLTDADGRVVIPAGASVRGRVTDAQASSRGGQQARIGLAFTSISYGGDTWSLDATTVGLPPVRRVNRQGTGETAAKVAGGAAVGAVLGRVIGRDRDAAIAGAAVGAAAGTAVAIGTADVDAVINAGSTATVRLDSPISVQREV